MAPAWTAGRVSVLTSLVAVIALAWAYVGLMAAHGMGSAGALAPARWSAGYAAMMLAMWVLMMVAMMLPSALPTILIVDRFNRAGAPRPGYRTALFASGYLLVWAGFAAAATLLQWGLERTGVLEGSMALGSMRLAAALYIAAGAYQFTPLKRTCLDACRSPIAFLSARWRPGAAGALRLGLAHGLFCLGCCWVLMALLFAGGVMNLLWIVPLALFVLVEKCLPGGERAGKLAGALLVGWGAVVLITA